MDRVRRVVVGVLCGLCIGLLGCGQQEKPSSQPTQPEAVQGQQVDEGTIVAMGNSLTAGLRVPEDQAYPAQLEQMLRAQGYPFRVVNAGVSGETSSGALTRTEWMLTLKPDIVILETGANDGLRGVDPALTRDNIESIVNTLTAHQVIVVLAGMRMVRNLGEEYTTAFAQVYTTVAQKHDLILIPFFLAGVAGDPALNQADGIHPTVTGYEIVIETIYPHVVTAIQKMRSKKRS